MRKRITLLIQHCAQLLDWIFPQSPDEAVLTAHTDVQFSTRYQPLVSRGVHTVLPFSEPVVQAALRLCKFRGHPRATHLLGESLARYLSSKPAPLILIPVPLSSRRYRVRGYNQVTEICRAAITAGLEAEIDESILYRSRNTVPQTSLTKDERQTNLVNAFSLTQQALQNPRLATAHVVLVDDVHTTGATLKAAKTALAPLTPASLTVLAIAH